MKTLLTRFRQWLAQKIAPLPQIQISRNQFEAIPPAATRVFDPVDHLKFWATAQPAPTSKLDAKYAPNITINKITISDRGDASVGINGGWWELNLHGEEIDGENLNLLRQDLMNLYSSWNEFPADFCEFDFESDARMQSEREHDEYQSYMDAYDHKRGNDERLLHFNEWKAQKAQQARANTQALLADPVPFDDQPVNVPMLAASIFMLFVVAILAV